MRPPKRPYSSAALSALLISLIALGIALLGALNWDALRFQADGPPKAASAVGMSLITGVLPIVLGVVAALLGRYAFRVLDHAHGKVAGSGFAFFSLMIGLFAVTIGACTTFAAVIWPRMIA